MKAILQAWLGSNTRLAAILVSCAFSLIVIAGNPVPNDDAFGYLKAAEVFNEDGLNAMLSAYGWYGYSALIAIMDRLLPISMLASAHLLNTLLFAVLVYAFITLVAEFDGNRETTWFAALVILCYPTLNEMRYLLIRDFGFWACCLAALVQLLRYQRTGGILHGGAWLVAITGAIFFRLEGLLMLALSPLALLLPATPQQPLHLRAFLNLVLMMAGGAIVVLALSLLLGLNLLDIFRYAWRWYLPLLADFSATLQGAADGSSVSEHLSGQLAIFTGKGLIALVTGFLYLIAANLFMALGPAASCFTAWCLVTGRATFGPGKSPWLFFLGSSLLALLVFVAIMQFLTTRYAVMASLLLMVPLTLGISTLWRAALNNGKTRLFRNLLYVGVFYFAVDSLISFGYSKQYMEDAIAWSQSNIPAGSTLHTNSFAIAYYSGLVETYDEIMTEAVVSVNRAQAGDYLAIDLAHDENAVLALLESRPGLMELARFANKRGDAVVFYRMN